MSYYKGFNYLATLGVNTSEIITTYTNRKLNRSPINSWDGDMYDVIKKFLRKNKKVAKQVRKALRDKRITKNFCDESKLYEQAARYTAESSFTKSMRGVDTYEAAWIILRSMLPAPAGNLEPLDINSSTDVSKIFSNPEASAGILAYPKHKSEVPDLILQTALHIMKDYDKTFSLPAIALTRAQITDYINDEGEVDSSNIKHKTRLVMCVDAASVLVEQKFGQPLLDNVFRNFNQYAGCKDDSRINSFLLEVCARKRWVSLDYSKFDASIQDWLIKDIFNFLSEYFSSKHKKAFDWISNNFIHMQLLMPDGTMINLHKGIKSGSFFTQMVGSLANILMILTYLVSKFAVRRENGSLNLTPVYAQLMSMSYPDNRNLTIMAMGDDNIFFTYDEIDVKDLSNYLYHNFRAQITIDGEKGVDTGLPGDTPHFLKRDWTKLGQFRDDVEMWVNLLHPERERTYEGYSPYHILYGYYLTFRGTVSKYISYDDIVKGMYGSSAGVDALLHIKLYDLPGSLRSQILNRGVDRAYMVNQIKDYAKHSLAL